MKRWFVVVLLATGLLAGGGSCVAENGPLEVRISLSNTKAMLGEPLWVDVSVTNRSAGALRVDWGADCANFNQRPIAIAVAEAQQGGWEPKPCGMESGNCMVPGPELLAAGATAQRRYVLAGDFRIVRPGHYTVVVEKKLRYGGSDVGKSMMLGQDAQAETQTLRAELEITPADPGKLLALEQALAAKAAGPFEEAPLKVPEGLDHEAYMAAVRAWSDERRQLQQEHVREVEAIYAGLIAYPAAGMEPVFEDDHKMPNGVAALYHLNTPAAREALARLAVLPNPATDRNASSVAARRFGAADALGRMGDREYLPLLERLAGDANDSVRMLSVLAVGRLGGEAALGFLDRYAREATRDQDRRSAIQAMALTKSAKAVPLLIALFTVPVASEDPGYWLMSLTHHQVARDVFRDPRAQQAAWQEWWDTHAAIARMFGPEDCVEAFTE